MTARHARRSGRPATPPPDRRGPDSESNAAPGPGSASRVARALRRAGVTSVQELRAFGAEDLRVLPGIGPVHAGVVEQLLRTTEQTHLEASFASAEVAPEGPAPLVESDRRVLRLRYAPDGNILQTYAAVATAVGSSEPRIVQLRTRALTKLGRIAQALRAGQPLSEAAMDDLAEFGALFVRWWEGKLR
jgi:hypothetical protein